MAIFFTRADIQSIAEPDLNEILLRHEVGGDDGATYLTNVITRCENIVFTHVDHAGFNADDIRAQVGADRDSVLLGLIDSMVFCSLWMTCNERMTDEQISLFNNVNNNNTKKLMCLSKAQLPISTRQTLDTENRAHSPINRPNLKEEYTKHGF